MAGACAIPGCTAAPATAPPAPEATAQARSAITEGTADTGDEAVVGIVTPMVGLECTGVLVTPYLVLTAAHCTDPSITTGATVVTGPSLASPGVPIPIASAVPDPQFDPTTLDGDVGVLVLGSGASAAPIAIATAAPSIGDTLEIVGWGVTGADASDTGTRRKGTAKVTAVDATTFTVAADPSQPCVGDSGGPALATLQGTVSVVGITSHGDAACLEGATYMRADAFQASFITPTLARFAAGSAQTGSRCLFPQQCAGGATACVPASDDPSLTYCTKSCSSAADCPSSMACVSAGSGMQCRYAPPTPGAYGAPCKSDTDCVEGSCTTTDVCALRCTPDVSSCPNGYACQQTGEIDFFCITTPATPAPSSGGGCALEPGRTGDYGWGLVGLGLALGMVRRSSHRRS